MPMSFYRIWAALVHKAMFAICPVLRDYGRLREMLSATAKPSDMRAPGLVWGFRQALLK